MVKFAMKYVYYGYGKKDKVGWGVLQADDTTIIEGKGDPWRGFSPDKSQTDINDVRLFRPVAPGQIIEVDGHASLVKAPARTFGPNDKAVFPRRVRQVTATGKLAVIMGKKAANLKPTEVMDCVLGFTGVLEFNAANLHKSEVGAAFGPIIVTEFETDTLGMRLAVNRQLLRTTTVRIDIASEITQASQQRTLLPGDVVLLSRLTLPDFQTSLLFPGDVVQLDIDYIGTLSLLCGPGR